MTYTATFVGFCAGAIVYNLGKAILGFDMDLWDAFAMCCGGGAALFLHWHSAQ